MNINKTSIKYTSASPSLHTHTQTYIYYLSLSLSLSISLLFFIPSPLPCFLPPSPLARNPSLSLPSPQGGHHPWQITIRGDIRTCVITIRPSTCYWHRCNEPPRREWHGREYLLGIEVGRFLARVRHNHRIPLYIIMGKRDPNPQKNVNKSSNNT